MSSASNPADTITVTAYLTGVIARVDLDSSVTALTESQLSQQIQAVAEVAVKRASAVMHIAMVKVLMDDGMDFPQARDFAENMLPFTTPAQADAAAVELVARFADGDPTMPDAGTTKTPKRGLQSPYSLAPLSSA